jgi:hypothetical protein
MALDVLRAQLVRWYMPDLLCPLFGEEIAAGFPCGASSCWLVKRQIDCAGRSKENLREWSKREEIDEEALQGDHELSSTSFSPDALPAFQVKDHNVDYNTYEELHFLWDYFGKRQF